MRKALWQGAENPVPTGAGGPSQAGRDLPRRGRLDFRRIITSPATRSSAPTFRQMLSDLIILTAGVIVAYNSASAFDTVIREADGSARSARRWRQHGEQLPDVFGVLTERILGVAYQLTS